jgi:hypothetical protein
MSTFNAHLRAISTDPRDSDASREPLSAPIPADSAALYGLVRDQFATLAQTAPTDQNRTLLLQLIDALELDAPPEEIHGVTQEYLDGLDRVPRKRLRKDDACPICADPYLEQEHTLVVQLPCHDSHKFDLECVAPWLLSKGTCPLCRTDFVKKKKVEVPKADDEEENEDPDMMYA